MEYNVKVWRQKNAKAKGHFETYHVTDVEEDASFLEMLDILNDQLIRKGIEPIAFDHDCREGICGACSLYVDGRAHGPDDQVTTCQLFMRHFKPGATITVEPWRSGAFPVIKDLVVDRTAFDKIMQAGGFITVRTGSAQDGNNILIPHDDAELSMDAAACVGCGACVATCKNGSAMLFVAARVSSPCCRKAVRKLPAAPAPWWPRWTNWALVTAPTPAPARWSAPSTSPSTILPD